MSTKDNNIFLSIVIPTINSESFIDQTLSSICKEISTFNYNSEVIVVNDNIADNTSEAIISFIRKTPDANIKFVQNMKSCGQSVSTLNGLNVCSGKYSVIFDDDLQYDVKDIKRLVECITKDKTIKMVCGHKTENRNKRMLNSILRTITLCLLNTFFPKYRNKNYFTSFKIITRELNDKNIYYFWSIPSDGITSLPVSHSKSIRNNTNYNLWRLIKGFHFLIVKFIQRFIIAFTLALCVIYLFRHFFFSTVIQSGELLNLSYLVIVYLITFIWLKIINIRMLNSTYDIVYGDNHPI